MARARMLAELALAGTFGEIHFENFAVVVAVVVAAVAVVVAVVAVVVLNFVISCVAHDNSGHFLAVA